MDMKKRIIFILVLFFSINFWAVIYLLRKQIDNSKKMENKYYTINLLFSQWILNQQNQKNIASYLKKNDFVNVAIYGMGDVGKVLLSELQKNEIDVSYIIDRNVGEIFLEIPVITPEDYLDDVDAIIVTPFMQFLAIKEILQKKVSCPIISIADIVRDL